MKPAKRILALVLLMAALGSLTACAIPGTPGSTASTEATTAQDRDREQLFAILDDIAANVRPGTAGSAMTAVRITAKLVAWASKTEMTKMQVVQAVGQWLNSQPAESREAFKEQLRLIADSYSQMLLDGAKDLLESADVQDTISEYTDKLKEIVDAILASGGIEES